MKQRVIYIISFLMLVAFSFSGCRSKQLCPAYLTDIDNTTEVTASVEK